MGRIIGSSFFYQSSAYLDVEGSFWWISARKGLGWQTHNTHSFPAVAGSLRFSPLISSPATTRFYFIPEISVGQAPELVCVLSVFPDSPRCISLWCRTRIPYALLTSSTRTQDTPNFPFKFVFASSLLFSSLFFVHTFAGSVSQLSHHVLVPKARRVPNFTVLGPWTFSHSCYPFSRILSLCIL